MTWKNQDGPSAKLPLPLGEIYGESCPSAKSCIAVGFRGTSPGTTYALAEEWNGKTWSLVPAPNPAGATYAGLTSVACSSATACTAVGQWENGPGDFLTLAERWNGATWRIQSTPSPGAQFNLLFGVSCPTARSCTAVGYHSGSGHYHGLAEAWDGKTWTVKSTLSPAGATDSYLNAVSCSSSTACTAVGNYDNSSSNFPLVEAWGGQAWSAQKVPSPADGSNSIFFGVSCISATICTAVGNYDNASGTQVTLAEVRKGTAWSIKTPPNPAGAAASELLSVSCPSSTACGAVGDSYNSSGTYATLAESWNGKTWSIKSTPRPAAVTAGFLDAVSCSSATDCVSGGWWQNSSARYLALAEAWHGTAWSLKTTPSTSSLHDEYLTAVSCVSATRCTAVGFYENSASTDVTLAETWDGKTWTVQATSNPADSTASLLEGVSCASAIACTAVGSYWTSTGDQLLLAEAWNGKTWDIQTTPSPAGFSSSSLQSVSCASATMCMAVGYSVDGFYDFFTMSEIWNGTAWSLASTPDPGEDYNALYGVSCTSPTACTAVGYYYHGANRQLALAESWNGSAWAVQPIPGRGAGSLLYAISCTSATACTAAGGYNSNGTEVTLAQDWNGAAWTVQPTSSPKGASASILDGLWCTSAEACTAVGEFDGQLGQLKLTETWNGTDWRLHPSVSSAGFSGEFLYGVSCAKAKACTAVGTEQNHSGTQVPLAEELGGHGTHCRAAFPAAAARYSALPH